MEKDFINFAAGKEPSDHIWTPHNGSNLAKLGKLVSNIVAACTPIGAARKLVTTLQKDSEVLFEITSDFVKIRKTIRLVSFFELEMTHIAPLIKRLVVERQSAILNLPDEVAIGQYSDHREIVRFKSGQDRNFRPVLSRLKKFEEDIKIAMDSRKAESQDRVPLDETDHNIPLDIPIAPCQSFHGRGDVLEVLSSYFYAPESTVKRRRSFAVCGLGGSGKTQTALYFLLHNAHKYKTGVFVIDASSTASLESGFARAHSLLRLKDANDKVASVKYFLSRRSEWLVFFDNADDLPAINLPKYFPIGTSGHIIITSRDQNAIGNIADDGCVLGPLTSTEACDMLLDLSGIKLPSNDQKRDATEIVELLGSLPLAIYQAGAFMRSRHKSPKDYKALFLKSQQALLGFAPRLANSQRTVLSTWELNFKQVEEESLDARNLLLLFCFLNPLKIPEILLHRGTSPRKRWAEDGEMTEVAADAEGVDIDIADLIQDEMRFDTAVDVLRSFSFVDTIRDSDELRSFSVHPLVQYCAVERISPADANKWRWQAILLVCHAFPRNRYLEPLNGEIGRDMMPQLAHIIGEFDKLSLTSFEPKEFHHEIASTFLAASRYSDNQWKMNMVDRAKELLETDPDPYMKAWLASRESSVLRMTHQQGRSELVLENFLQETQMLEPRDKAGDKTELTARYNAERGDLVISFAENLIRRSKLQEAKMEISEWRPLSEKSPSALERITLRARDTILGKVLRYQGRFDEALPLLQNVLDECFVDDFFEGSAWYRVLLSNVADLLAELDRPAEARELIQRELQPMYKRGTQDIATGRRLRVSLAETLLQEGKFDEAKDVLLRLEEAHRNSNSTDHSMANSLFRVLIGLARVYHKQSLWDQALSYWKKSLENLGSANIEHGFNAGIVRYSIAHILHIKGDKMQSHLFQIEAKRDIEPEDQVFWIACFNSKWYEDIVKSIEKECKC
ncbi:hypothetical protein ABW19_dt0207138 [Dactylella cylindrospora]|nr:hypothetical protein ABW19_dt0207138 [Dactylella cylindrospora]